jgi:hypothetical protein
MLKSNFVMPSPWVVEKAEGTEGLRGALPYPPTPGIEQSSLLSHFHILDLLRHYSFLFETAVMSTGVGMSSCCISGAAHEGTPKGRVDTIGGLSCYVTEPEGGSTAKLIVFITDSKPPVLVQGLLASLPNL